MKDNDYSDKSRQIHVLIVSDRLFDRAKELSEYLRGTGNVEVVGLAENKQQALNIAQGHSFDYLIIAGYLKAERTYDVIGELKKQGKEFLSVQWAMLDSLIAEFCRRYQIPLRFERTRSMEEFVRFLDLHHHK